MAWLAELTGGGPALALLVLFGLNAIEEAERDGFGVLVPNIRQSFHLGVQGVLTIVALVGVGALAVQVPIAYLADRTRRVRLMLGGMTLWSLFSLTTGVVSGVVMLAIVRSGTGLGRSVIDPTHNSLLADYFDVEVRPRAYSFHRAGNAVGACVGPLLAGLVAYAWGWRAPFAIFGVVALALVLVGLTLREPVRGAHERRAMGATGAAIGTEEEAPSFAEAWRTVWKIESLRRIWYALPFLAASLVGFASLSSLLYAQVFHLDERARGFVAAGVEPFAILGLLLGAKVGTRLLISNPARVMRYLAIAAFVVSGLAAVLALAPALAVAVAANALIVASLAVVGPGLLAALSLVIPPRCRSVGFSVASLWVLPGLILLPIIGWVADTWGIRQGMLLLTPVFLIGGLTITTAGSVMGDDIAQVWAAAAARSEVAFERRAGRSKLLLVRGLDVSYNGVQVLFGVDFDIDTGETVALLGTNGAGKSTLLKAIAGVVEADRGAVIFDGRESTWAPANEVAARGVVLMPGGAGVFPSLTVADNLKAAGWLARRHRAEAAAGRERALALFPVLSPRLEELAADLSGGQQQMLALAMALVSRPRLLMIDELSLGLAPVVVAQLLSVVRELKEAGTTVILVEQSINIALTLAATAFFMEKGEVRFHGPTTALLERPDVLRSVFLEGAGGRDRAPASLAVPPRVAPPGSTPVLATTALTRRFGGIAALDDVDLSVRLGEIVGIIGPNGAGKTTLFDVISGFVPADGGRVLLGGRDVTGLSASARARRGLGRSFQDARLFPAMTVDEAIAVALERWVTVRDPLRAALHLPAAFDAEEKVRARVDELVELMGLGAYRAKFVRELSTGTRRVVDLACLLAHRPTVILLDEPSSGIAQRETEALGPVLIRIRDEMGASLVVVEHDMALVTAVADRLVAMELGRVIADGDATTVLHDERVVDSYLGRASDAVLARSGPRPQGD
jgi:branched-chain amino acid transport system ATP-binding protein